MTVEHPFDLAVLFREVAGELAREGRPLTVPPDEESRADDDELFWQRVDERLSTRYLA